MNFAILTAADYVSLINAKFDGASAFNQDIGRWDVAAVTDMELMFDEAPVFNQDIGRWDVSSVKDMEGMFYYAKSFNQDISGWNVSAVTDMGRMVRMSPTTIKIDVMIH